MRRSKKESGELHNNANSFFCDLEQATWPPGDSAFPSVKLNDN